MESKIFFKLTLTPNANTKTKIKLNQISTFSSDLTIGFFFDVEGNFDQSAFDFRHAARFSIFYTFFI